MELDTARTIEGKDRFGTGERTTHKMTHFHANSPDIDGEVAQARANSSDEDEDDDVLSDWRSGAESSAEEQSRKPLTSFETSDDTLQDFENGFTRKGSKRPRRKGWWNSMAARTRRKHRNGIKVNDFADPVEDGLLMGAFARRRLKRKNGWYNYCIFGGISGLTILALLLLVNLILGFATLLWSENIDQVLKNWGKPGTGTEGLAWYPTDFTRDIIPIPCHSHNDYWRRVPLFDALRVGCSSVEADVWLFDEDLYVGHNTASLTRNRTFQSLYINPLVKILENQNQNTEFYNGTSHGVFDADPERSLILLVDLKTSGAATWGWVLKQLQPLRERGWLSYVENESLYTRPITVVGTGNTPFDVLTANATYRDAFFDAPLDVMWERRRETPEMKDWPDFDDSLPGESLDGGEGSAEASLPTESSQPSADNGQGKSGTVPSDEFNELNSYYASVSFVQAVGRIWKGKLSPKQMKIIRGQIRGAHRRGLKARYWDLPSWPRGLRNHIWDVLIREGVDMLNVDDLRAASELVW